MISDDGKGFDKDIIKSSRQDNNYGLLSMRERVSF